MRIQRRVEESKGKPVFGSKGIEILKTAKNVSKTSVRKQARDKDEDEDGLGYDSTSSDDIEQLAMGLDFD